MQQFYFILFSTFLVGFVAGVFVFFINKPEVEVTDPGSEETGRSIEITAEAYGGCQMAGPLCPSYRINPDGTYIYLAPQFDDEELKAVGELTSVEKRELAELVSAMDLLAVEESEFTGTCPIAFDGLAYRYEFLVNGEFAFVDTCESDASGALFAVLERYFSQFAAQ